MKKISVIIPVYGVEKYIRKCLESVVNQTYKNLEIIVVNDGTKDNSMEIVKEYLFDKRIKIINKENGGISSARNAGLEIATGDYISFVDSDDYISKNLYSELAKYMEEDYDMVKFGILTVDLKNNKMIENKSKQFENKTGEEAFDILYKTDKMTEVAWGYLYKASFWKENNFKFTKDM